MPVGDLPGWRQVFAEDLTEGDVAVGGFPGPYGATWSENYADGTPDTAAQQVPKGERKSGYYPSKVLSVHDGFLDMYLHSENGISMGAAPSPRVGGATMRPWNSQVYGRYSVPFRADALAGYKLAWLLWPDSKQWPQDGEIDFPEGTCPGSSMLPCMAWRAASMMSTFFVPTPLTGPRIRPPPSGDPDVLRHRTGTPYVRQLARIHILKH
jgi:hypothetical protein